MITDRNCPRLRKRPPCLNGFTLIELILVLAIIAITFRFALPTFQAIIADTRMTAQLNTMITSFNLARSEAVKRKKNVVLCPNDSGRCARVPHWHNGWLMFVDDDYDRELDDKEEIIYIEAARENIEIISSRYRRRVVFNAMGTSAGSNASYVFCDQRGPSKARAVILSNGGRARTAALRSDGKGWKCR